VITVRRYTFRAVVALDPLAREDAVRSLLDSATRACIVQPRGAGCFPAHISACGPLSAGSAINAVVHIILHAGEAEALFPIGQRFAVWADAIVDDRAIRGEGTIGDGIILGRGSVTSDNETLAPTVRRSLSPTSVSKRPEAARRQ